MAKEYLKSKKVEYIEKDVTKDAKAYQDILEKSGQLGVPVIEIDNTIIVGFDRPSIDASLREKKLI
jgi:glutaredoxin